MRRAQSGPAVTTAWWGRPAYTSEGTLATSPATTPAAMSQMLVFRCLEEASLHVRDRLADVRLPGGDLATLLQNGLHLRVVQEALWSWPYPAQSFALATTLIVLVAGPPITSTVLLGAVLTGEVTCLLELLLHVMPLDPRPRLDGR